MDNKSIIIGILIVVVVVLGIGVFMASNYETPTNSTNNTTNNTNGSGNITPVPNPTPVHKNKTGKLLTASQAIAIVKASAPDALDGSFTASLTTYMGKTMYRVTYAVAQDIGYDTVNCYVDARTGAIYGEYQTVSNKGGNNNDNNDNNNDNNDDNSYQ